ncbi:MAG: T9SS type A sorting domain-containing protein, partial [Bacteroidota bacterium]
DQTPYLYVITDEDNMILATSADGVINFEGVPEGVCRIWGLSYTGNITAMIGDFADQVALSDDCFDLSDNFVTVTRLSEGNIAPNEGEGFQALEEERIVLNVFPNPAREFVNLQVSVPDNLLTNQQMVSVYNLSGTLLFQQQLAPQVGTAQQNLDISQLESGMYLLQWYDGERVMMTRFIKE